jgi:hypothetical protein
MIRTLHGRVHGKTIRLEEDLGVADGQEVEIQVKIVPATDASTPTMTEGLAKIYAVLGERYDSGHTDTAQRHNEHQP